MSSANKHAPSAETYRLPEGSGWANAWKYLLAVGVVGLLASFGGGYFSSGNQARFAFSYLFAFVAFLTLGLGSLFFVIIQYLTKAGWSVTVRRTAEFFMAGLPVFAVLVIPVILSLRFLYPWLDQQTPAEKSATHELIQPVYDPAEKTVAAPLKTQPDDTDKVVEQWRERREKQKEAAKAAEEERIMKHKASYLNQTFFLARMVAYFAVWIFLSWRYFRWSTDQDKSKDVNNTAAAQQLAPIALILFGVTVGFAAFDLLMSLMPMWYSTIFGVQIFATTTIANLATIILFTLLIRPTGALGSAVTTDHYHDLGKLLFGWLVFWAYVSFAQFFLIWYGNIPEEVAYFHRRWDDGDSTWKAIGFAIMILHFAVPFWFLMSRNIKRRVNLLAIGAALLLVMHVVEIYWDVLPNFPGSNFTFSPHWLDLTCFLGVGGIYLGVVLRLVAGHALIPVGDPRLVRALKFENA